MLCSFFLCVFGKREKKKEKVDSSGETKKQLLGYKQAKLSSLSVLVPALAMVQGRGWKPSGIEKHTRKEKKEMGKKNKETRTEFVTVRRQQLSGWKQTPSPSRKTEGGLRERERDKKTEAHWLPTKTLHQTLATHGHASAAVDPGNARAESS